MGVKLPLKLDSLVDTVARPVSQRLPLEVRWQAYALAKRCHFGEYRRFLEVWSQSGLLVRGLRARCHYAAITQKS